MAREPKFKVGDVVFYAPFSPDHDWPLQQGDRGVVSSVKPEVGSFTYIIVWDRAIHWLGQMGLEFHEPVLSKSPGGSGLFDLGGLV